VAARGALSHCSRALSSGFSAYLGEEARVAEAERSCSGVLFLFPEWRPRMGNEGEGGSAWWNQFNMRPTYQRGSKGQSGQRTTTAHHQLEILCIYSKDKILCN
jgi:hypothetical protein